MNNTDTKKLYLHIFCDGSGEHALHSYLSDNASSLGNILYTTTQYDSVSNAKSHTYVQQLIFHALYRSETPRNNYYYLNIKNFWKNLSDRWADGHDVFLSLSNSMFCWDLFWETGAEILDFSQILVQPILTLHHQEDALEFFYRHNVWHHLTSEPFLPTTEKYDYDFLCTSLTESAQKHGIPLNKPHVIWKQAHTDAADREVVCSVMHCCGLSGPEPIAPVNTQLRSYNALRFAALTLPPPFPSAFQALGIKPRFCADAWRSSTHRSVVSALRHGEMQGIFSMKPLSPASIRKKARELGAEGNAELSRQYPDLRAAMEREPEYPAHMAGEPMLSLTTDDIERCLELLSDVQKQWIVHCMDTEFKELTDEQKAIKACLLKTSYTKISEPSPQYGVSVLTLSYNVKNYIAQNIESVMAQQCSVPVQHIIVDDGSDDGTQEIIERYASRCSHIKPVLLPRFPRHDGGDNVKTLFGRCRTKYAAICDGDDYFTDPLKLQKQVDFLEKFPECALCFHPVDVIYEDGSPSRTYPPENLLPGGVRKFYTIKDLLFANLMQTNSVMYRWRFQAGLPEWFEATLVPSDWYWHFLHAELGLMGYLPDHMSVYRRHASSLYASAEGDHVAHRAIHGLEELRTYATLNKHFRGRYYRNFCSLAASVLTDFIHIYATTDDDTLFQKGTEICPDFARDFLRQIKISGQD